LLLRWREARQNQEVSHRATRELAEEKEDLRRRTGGSSTLEMGHGADRVTPMTELEDVCAIRDLSYYLNDLNVIFEAVNPYELPTNDIIKHLFGAYMA
jgi:hypothetical protein